jgi:signal transduction histidine kinase/DNA-binding response OmpR family regulator
VTLRILLVEDDELNQALVQAILARSGDPALRESEVTVAGSVAQARTALAASSFDVVLLDMRLPDSGGMFLATELRLSGGASPVVIAVTGAAAEHGSAALAAGCAAVLGKPYSPAELCEVVLRHVPSGQRRPANDYVGPLAPGHWGAVMSESPAQADEGGAIAPPEFQLLFEAAPGMFVALSPDLRIVAVSDAYLLATGTSRGELVGQNIWEAFPGEDPLGGKTASLQASLERVRRDRVAHTMDTQKQSIPRSEPDGEMEVRCWSRSNMPVLGARGKLCYFICRVDEVTDQVMLTEGEARLRRRAQELELRNEQMTADSAARSGELQEAQRAANDAKNEFVSRVSHELRTPINTILGFGELLSLGDLSADHQEWASMILTAAKRLTSFLDDMLDISRVQTRTLAMSIDAASVDTVIASALELIRPLAAAKGVHLDQPPHTGEHVLADQQRLRQVLLNLLSNAVKYNHPGGNVTICADHQPGSRLRISVSDTGRGIADHDIGQLFTPFQRLDAAQAGIEGVGLGLTLSRQLIEAMGGAVGATSAPGEGSVFWVELPISESAAASPTADVDDPLATARAYPAPKTLLYVEDMVENLRLVEHILKQRPSTRVVPAMLGAVALDLAAEHHPDLILLDLNLPDMPGEELLHRIQSDPATSDTPVIIISADASQERINRLLRAGASAYLTKPISVRNFLNIIDTMLDHRHPARQARTPASQYRIS